MQDMYNFRQFFDAIEIHLTSRKIFIFPNGQKYVFKPVRNYLFWSRFGWSSYYLHTNMSRMYNRIHKLHKNLFYSNLRTRYTLYLVLEELGWQFHQKDIRNEEISVSTFQKYISLLVCDVYDSDSDGLRLGL